jgi:hypothetical protein
MNGFEPAHRSFIRSICRTSEHSGSCTGYLRLQEGSLFAFLEILAVTLRVSLLQLFSSRENLTEFLSNSDVGTLIYATNTSRRLTA